MQNVNSAAQQLPVYGVKMTRREFFKFFIIGGIFSLIGKKVRAGTKPQKAKFWRKINEDKK